MEPTASGTSDQPQDGHPVRKNWRKSALIYLLVAVAIAGTASPLEGSATLTDAQAADLTSGKWYVNVHTATNKGGEIRGQVHSADNDHDHGH